MTWLGDLETIYFIVLIIAHQSFDLFVLYKQKKWADWKRKIRRFKRTIDLVDVARDRKKLPTRGSC